MANLLLLSHSQLAESIYETVKLIMGKPSDSVSYITLPYGQDLQAYQAEIEAHVEKAKDEGILILTDLFGGSPFMISVKTFDKYHDTVPIEIISGMNLSMVVELVNAISQSRSLNELKEIALNAGINGIVDFKAKLNA